MKKGLRDYRPTSKDLQNQYKVCELCRDKIYMIESGTEIKRVNCGQCGAKDVANYKDYFISER